MTPENHRSPTHRRAVKRTTCAPPAQAQTAAITNYPSRPAARPVTGEGVPSTVWAPPPGAIGARWRPWVIKAVTRAFLPPHGRWIDMADHLDTRRNDILPGSGLAALAGGQRGGEDPAADRCATDRGPQRVVPFWAALIDSPSGVPQSIRAPVSPQIPIRSDRGAAAADTGVDLVFVELADVGVDDRIGVLAAHALRAGGILAVLTRCRPGSDQSDILHTPGDVGEGLIDRTGTVVASAQNADLLYLQHIVIPTRPLTPPAGPSVDRAAPASAAPAAAPESVDAQPQHGNAVHRWRRHEIDHTDLLVFARPPGAGPAARGSAGSEGVTGSGAGSVAGAR